MMWTKLEAGDGDTNLLYPLFLKGRRQSILMRDMARDRGGISDPSWIITCLPMAPSLCLREQQDKQGVHGPAASHSLAPTLLQPSSRSSLTPYPALSRDVIPRSGGFLSLAHLFLRPRHRSGDLMIRSLRYFYHQLTHTALNCDMIENCGNCQIESCFLMTSGPALAFCGAALREKA